MSAQANRNPKKPSGSAEPTVSKMETVQDGMETVQDGMETVQDGMETVQDGRGDGAAPGELASPLAAGGSGGELSGANPPPDIAAEYEVVQPLYGIDEPGVKRMPGYRFHGNAADYEPLVKQGYLKRV
jgi:X-X-X-Leu-X-X-Gly heptad repeat protein